MTILLLGRLHGQAIDRPLTPVPGLKLVSKAPVGVKRAKPGQLVP